MGSHPLELHPEFRLFKFPEFLAARRFAEVESPQTQEFLANFFLGLYAHEFERRFVCREVAQMLQAVQEDQEEL